MAMDLGSGSVFFSGFGFGLEKFMDPDPVRFVLRGWIRIRSASDRIRNPAYEPVGWLVGRSVVIELKSGKTRISAPAHPSATDGRVSGLVHYITLHY